MSDGPSTQELPPEPVPPPAIQTWQCQVYAPQPAAPGHWVPVGPPAEWRAVSAYTAAARAIVGDSVRPPVALTAGQVLAVSTGETIWLTAEDLDIIRHELASLALAGPLP